MPKTATPTTKPGNKGNKGNEQPFNVLVAQKREESNFKPHSSQKHDDKLIIGLYINAKGEILLQKHTPQPVKGKNNLVLPEVEFILPTAKGGNGHSRELLPKRMKRKTGFDFVVGKKLTGGKYVDERSEKHGEVYYVTTKSLLTNLPAGIELVSLKQVLKTGVYKDIPVSVLTMKILKEYNLRTPL